MNAPKTSQTVPLEKPVSAKRSDSSASLKPGFASSARPNNTHGEKTVTVVRPSSPIAGAGSGSVTRPAMTPAKIAKKYHACGSSPCGAGRSAIIATIASGTATRHGAFLGDVATSSAIDVIVSPSSSRVTRSRHELHLRRGRPGVEISAAIHVIIDFGRAAEHSRIQEDREGCGFQRLLGKCAAPIRLPQHFEKQRGDHRIDVHAVNGARHAGVEQRLYERVVVLVEHVVFAALGEQLADVHFARIEIDGTVFEHRVIDAGDL